MSRQVIIDKINIRLPRGWQGDATHLALKIAEQIQRQAADLHSAQRLDFSLKGDFSGVGRQVTEQLGAQLAAPGRAAATRRRE